jgi:Ca2+-binding RTX toxin-like protein
MPTILNWGYSIGNRTLSTTSPPVDIPRLLTEDGFPEGNFDSGLPENLRGKFDSGISFAFAVNNEGTGVFTLDENGLKIVKGTKKYATTNGDDDLVAYGYPPGVLSSGLYSNALELSTLRLGAGNDSFAIIGNGITQSLSTTVGKDESAGYIFQSNIFGEDGDDYISALMPFQSVFKGGSNTAYHDAVNDPGGSGVAVTLSDDLTLEEIEFGDTLVLKGSRYDWDLEFKDADGAGVSLASILGGSDYIATSNNNQISGFERIRFGDILFDVVLYDQVDSSAVYGQPDYYLTGNEKVAPGLNSSIADSELWEAFRFNRTKLSGIAGTATDRLLISLGDDVDTPYLAGGGESPYALMFARLSAGGGGDIVYVQDSDQADIDLGAGADQLRLGGDFSLGSIEGGTEADNIILQKVVNASVSGGDADDVVEIGVVGSQSSFDGGAGSDRILLSGSFAAYSFTYVDAATDDAVVFTDGYGNTYRAFERYQFSDGELTFAQLKARSELSGGGGGGASGPASAPRVSLVGETSVTGGDAAAFAVYLDGTLAADGVIVMDLYTASGTATEDDDFSRLVAADLTASPGLTLSGVVTEPVTKAITLTITNTSGTDLAPGSQLLSFALDTVRPASTETAETFTTTLSSPNIAPDTSSVVTTIAAPVAVPGGGGGGGDGSITVPPPPAPPPSLVDPVAPLTLPGGGSFVTADLITGPAGDLQGTPQSDVITGGFGPDVLRGGPGTDQLTGGPGADVFVIDLGDRAADQILDFEPGQDRIRIEEVTRRSKLGRFLKGKSTSRKALEAISGKKEAKKSEQFFAYDDESGRIYFNANRGKNGLGFSGGVVAVLAPGLKLDGSDLLFSFSDPTV